MICIDQSEVSISLTHKHEVLHAGHTGAGHAPQQITTCLFKQNLLHLVIDYLRHQATQLSDLACKVKS